MRGWSRKVRRNNMANSITPKESSFMRGSMSTTVIKAGARQNTTRGNI